MSERITERRAASFLTLNRSEIGRPVLESRVRIAIAELAFARRCGLHPSYMGEIERGETNLTLTSLLLITKRLQTTIAQLFEDIG